jgi:hypothetical protein
MHSDHQEIRPHKNRHQAERFEGLLGKIMVAAIVVLAIGMVWAIVAGGNSTPTWMR